MAIQLPPKGANYRVVADQHDTFEKISDQLRATGISPEVLASIQGVSSAQQCSHLLGVIGADQLAAAQGNVAAQEILKAYDACTLPDHLRSLSAQSSVLSEIDRSMFGVGSLADSLSDMSKLERGNAEEFKRAVSGVVTQADFREIQRQIEQRELQEKLSAPLPRIFDFEADRRRQQKADREHTIETARLAARAAEEERLRVQQEHAAQTAPAAHAGTTPATLEPAPAQPVTVSTNATVNQKKLTDAQRAEVATRYKQKESVSSLADAFNVSRRTIDACLNEAGLKNVTPRKGRTNRPGTRMK